MDNGDWRLTKSDYIIPTQTRIQDYYIVFWVGDVLIIAIIKNPRICILTTIVIINHINNIKYEIEV